MKSHLAILGAFFLIDVSADPVRDAGRETETDPLAEAIREFGLRDRSKPNEVTVVLDPPPIETPADAVPAAAEEEPEAALAPAPADDLPASLAADFTSSPDAGIAVRVETVRQGHGQLDSAEIKLHAPFPAKPMTTPPPGWRLVSPDHAPAITREVELSPGTHITLSVRPHLLAPEADGAATLAIPEPGYDPALGYHQTRTVGAVLAASIENLEEDGHNLGRAIERLQQLLVSLPNPEPEPSDP